MPYVVISTVAYCFKCDVIVLMKRKWIWQDVAQSRDFLFTFFLDG